LKNSKHNPKAWITHLEGLRMKLRDVRSTMTNKDLMVHILNNLTDNYKVSKLEEKLGTVINPLTIDDVKAELCLRYTHMKAKKPLSETVQKDSKQALAATGKYKGTCTFCGKIGHKATDCYMRKNEEKAQEDKKNNYKQKNAWKGEWSEEKVQLYKDNKCFFCKKPGQKLQDCRQKKAETETANATQETALMAMTTKAVSENTWIADSGATCHITNDLTGLYDI